MTLAQMLEKATPSDRLLVEDASGQELYRGYVACMTYGKVDTARTVKRFGLTTNIFRREKRAEEHMKEFRHCGSWKPEEVENISDFRFSDLEMMIYTRVILED